MKFYCILEYASRGGIKRVDLAKRGKTDPAIFRTREEAERFFEKTGLKTCSDVKYEIVEVHDS